MVTSSIIRPMRRVPYTGGSRYAFRILGGTLGGIAHGKFRRSFKRNVTVDLK